MRRDVTLLATLYLCNNRHIVLFLMIGIDNSETGRKEENKIEIWDLIESVSEGFLTYSCIIVRSDFLFFI